MPTKDDRKEVWQSPPLCALSDLSRSPPPFFVDLTGPRTKGPRVARRRL